MVCAMSLRPILFWSDIIFGFVLIWFHGAAGRTTNRGFSLLPKAQGKRTSYYSFLVADLPNLPRPLDFLVSKILTFSQSTPISRLHSSSFCRRFPECTADFHQNHSLHWHQTTSYSHSWNVCSSLLCYLWSQVSNRSKPQKVCSNNANRLWAPLPADPAWLRCW